MGVEVADRGYVVHNTFVTKKLEWHDIAGFDTKRWVFNHEVFIYLTSGERVRTSLIQGRHVIWKGGRTRDILSILRGELKAHAQNASLAISEPNN